jgi:hypothetical protein
MSMLARGVFYRVYGLFAGVLRVARRIVDYPFYPISLAFGFKFLVARDMPGSFLRFTDDVIVAPSLSIRHLLPSEMPSARPRLAGQKK